MREYRPLLESDPNSNNYFLLKVILTNQTMILNALLNDDNLDIAEGIQKCIEATNKAIEQIPRY